MKEAYKARIVMLVNNPCVNDSRVIREAEALVANGHQVTVLARRAPGLSLHEDRNGVDYRRLAGVSEVWLGPRRQVARLRRYLRAHRAGKRGMGSMLTPLVLGLLYWQFARAHKAAAQSAARIPAIGVPPVSAMPTVAEDEAASQPLSAECLPPPAPDTREAGAPDWNDANTDDSVTQAVSSRADDGDTLVLERPKASAAEKEDSRWLAEPEAQPQCAPAIAAASDRDSAATRTIRPRLVLPAVAQAPVDRIRAALSWRLIRAKRAIVRQTTRVRKAVGWRLTRLRRAASSRIAALRKAIVALRRRAGSIHAGGRRFISGTTRRVIGAPLRVGRRGSNHARAVTRQTSGHAKRHSTSAKRAVAATFKRWFAAAFIFEDVDVAMGETLIKLEPDVIHAHDLMTLPTASTAAARLGARLVYDSHELEMHRNASYPPFAWKRREVLERKHIRRSDLVITVGEAIADHLRDEYAIPRPAVILNAPPLRAHSKADATVRQHLGLAADVPLAIYVGSVTINRGLEYCVGALAHDRDLHFATIGPRRKPTEIELRGMAEAAGVSERFHFVDPVSPDAVVSFVRDADVSVLPIQNVCLSYYYCMPNKLFESVIGGLPVAVADLFELRRFVERYGCGVVMDETDPQDISRAIKAVIKDRADYLMTGERLDHIVETYTWPAQARRLVESYAAMTRQ